MIKLKSSATSKLISVMVLVLAIFQPIFVLAQEVPADPPVEPPVSDPVLVDPPVVEPEPAPVPTPDPVLVDPPAPEPIVVPAPTTPGPSQPTGASGNTYEYNPATGMWENDYYTWDPVTRQTSPKQPQTYSYNPATGRWDTEEWYYNPVTGRYEENIYSVPDVPEGAIVDLPPELVAALGLETDEQGNPIWSTNNTGPDSKNKIDLDNNSNSIFDLFYDSSISNTINSNAQSGDALVSGNTTGGSALTGDAAAMVNLINMIQSNWGFGSSPLLFISNLFGDIVGDLMINPGTPDGSGNGCGLCQGGDVDVNVDINGNITNDVILNAQSGNAGVTGNTTAGSATTGDANAVANIVNMINSAISAGQSFFGVLNIFGNLEGDILFPDGFLDDLLAANSGSTSPINTEDNDSEVNINLEDNQTINNNIGLGASSGNATVSGNTTAGSATTGAAETSLTLLNLTGRQVIGGNALLVFVNVLGNWLGLIMDAPSGTTAAAVGGDIEENSCVSCIPGGDADIDVNSNSVIDNNILVNAASGDADVSHNTTAGNATTGNASASANILNMTSSQFSLTNWFGVLFINVFGDWSGSFGVDTAFGELPQSPSVAKPKSNNSSSNNRTTLAATGAGWNQYPTTANEPTNENQESAALSANVGSGSYSPQPAAQENGFGQYVWTLGGFGLGVALLALERFLTLRRPEESLGTPTEAKA